MTDAASRIEVLGPIRARVGREHVEVTSPTQQLLLGVLAAARPHAVSRHRLIEAIWDDEPPPSADNSLNSHLSRLRSTLGPGAVARSGDTYQLAWPVDAVELEVTDGTVESLRAVDGLWRGEPFGALADHPALVRSAAELRGRRGAVRRRIAELLLDGDRPDEAVDTLRAALDDDPSDEGAWTQLVDALVDGDRRVEAVRAAQAGAAALAQVGLLPGPRLVEAERRALDPITRRDEVTERLVGRSAEVRELSAALHTHRWVTVVGTGGVGKTRLVAEVTNDDGATTPVAVCDLSAASKPSDVALTIADVIGASTVPPVAEQVTASLRRRPRLVVLDACEHCADHVRELAPALLAAPDVRVLATSRRSIGIHGERLVELGPLEPDEALELFERRAAEHGESPGTAGVIVEICRRVDHLPLGIEMAASLLRALEPAELLLRMRTSMDVLQAADRSPRHRSLLETIERSIELLDATSTRAMLDLATFVAPFSIDRAEELLGRRGMRRADVPCVIATLRNASLLHPVRSTGGRRLQMLDTVRAVALDHLQVSSELDAANGAHVATATALARRIGSGIVTADERRWASVAEAELPDLRVAHRRAVAMGDAVSATAIVTSLFQYAYDRIRPEVGEWADETLERFPDVVDVGALSVSAALGAFQVSELDRAEEHATFARRSSPEPKVAARAGIVLANVHLVAGRLDLAVRDAAASTEQADGDPYLLGLAQLLLAVAACYAGDDDRAAASSRRLGELATLPGMAPSLTAYDQYVAAELSTAHDPEGARRHLAACLATARSVGNSICEGVALVTAGTLTSDDDPEAARQDFLRIIAHWHERPDRYRQWITLRNHAVTLTRCGEHRTAATVLGAAEAHAPPAYGAEAERIRRAALELDRELGPDLSARLRRVGAASSLADIVELCLDGPTT